MVRNSLVERREIDRVVKRTKTLKVRKNYSVRCEGIAL